MDLLSTLNARPRPERGRGGGEGPRGDRRRARASPAAAARLASPSTALVREALGPRPLPGDRSLRARLVPLVGAKEPWLRGPALPALARADRDSFSLVLSEPRSRPRLVRARGPGVGPGGRGRRGRRWASSTRCSRTRTRACCPRCSRRCARRGAPTRWTPCAATSSIPTSRCAPPRPRASRPSKTQGLTEALARGLQALAWATAPTWTRAWTWSPPSPSRRTRGRKEALAEIAASDPLRVVRERAAAALSAALGRRAARDAGPRRPGPSWTTAWPWRPTTRARARPSTRPARSSRRSTAPSRSCSTWWRRRSPPPPSSTSRGAASTTASPSTAWSRASWSRAGVRGATATAGPATPCAARSRSGPTAAGRWAWPSPARTPGAASSSSPIRPQPHLDGGYTLFGQVVNGMEVVDKIRPGDVIERVEIWTGR